MLIDTHTHLNFKAFDQDRDQVIAQAVNSGVRKMIVVGTNIDTSRSAIGMAESNSALSAAIGIHPHHAKKYLNLPTNQRKKMIQQDMETIEEMATHKRVVAIGEVGLDQHQYKSASYQPIYTPEEWTTLVEIQEDVLIRQVKIAQKHSLPLILHSRQLKDQVLQTIMTVDSTSPLSGVFHCFEGSKKYLKKILQAGFYVSFTGNITYISDRQPIANLIPLEKLLIETDSPFMSPEPVKTQRNQPANAMYIASHHANQRQLSLKKIVQHTTHNALHLFPRLEI